MSVDDCLFCDGPTIQNGLIQVSSSFYHRAVDIGSMAPGHTMLITREHLSCYGAMPEDLDQELDSFTKEIQLKLKLRFSDPIIIEQGIHGQSVYHAHKHLLPSVAEWYDFSNVLFTDLIPKEVSITRGVSHQEIREIFEKEGEYVSIEQQGIISVCHVSAYSGKLRAVRDIPARITGNNSFSDWRTMTEEAQRKSRDWFAETIAALRD